MPSPPTKRRILVQAGHNKPMQPRHLSETGANGEAELVARIQKRLVAILQSDTRFEPLPKPGLIPDHTKADAAVYLHGDGAGPTATWVDVTKNIAGLPPWGAFAQIAPRSSRSPAIERRQNAPTTPIYYGFGLVDSAGPETLIEHGFLSNPTEKQ
jgi:N-acetylmuramoyl-L-alanine amidase